MSELIIYEQPNETLGKDDFTVSVREPGGVWQALFVFEAKVDMHQVRSTSMVYFDMEGTVEVSVHCNNRQIEQAVIRPLATHIPFQIEENTLLFTLEHPCKLSIEINGERFSNLHLFANPLETAPPILDDDNVVLVQPGIHQFAAIAEQVQYLSERANGERQTIYFMPGLHQFENPMLHIPSGTTVYIAGGALLCGSIMIDHAENVVVRGRGVLYLADMEKTTYLRGVQIQHSEQIEIEGIITLDPPHYSIYIGASKHIRIHNFKAFSTRGWCDGIDMMASSNVDIKDVFLRTSDDCIAIYGSRGEYYGDSRHITVKDSILWADVAHAMHVGIHGDHQHIGDFIENIWFENIDVLEHHEPQENYWGVMAICAGDNNTVRKVTFKNIRVEDFELGQLFDVRVVWNKTYNPVPGRCIENIEFSDITYNGKNTNPSRIFGYDEERGVKDIYFYNLQINGEVIVDLNNKQFVVNEFASGIYLH
ncbi:glycosyl hydrolase family 28 protein [Paenibacillus sp. FSL R10-2796]|uniref:glycosyl hydrolase family 28 protein n=1 Tax=Paenibacillus sp. FSL R10-2796 TaxID=2954663 RepID=UPI0030D972A0